MAAEFSVTTGGIKGYIATDTQAAQRKLEEADETLCSEFTEELAKAGVNLDGEPSVAYVTSKNLSLEQFYRGSGTGETTGSQVQTRTLYTVARVFLKSLTGIKAVEEA